jgi:hypothetical protein
LFGDENPPLSAQSCAASGVVRYSRKASAASLFLNSTKMSPPPTTAGSDPSIDGNVKTL